MITAENIIRPLRTGCLLDRSLALPTRYSYSIQSECYTYVVPPLRTIRYSRVFFVISRTSTRRSTSFYKLEPRRRSNSGEWTSWFVPLSLTVVRNACWAMAEPGTIPLTAYRVRGTGVAIFLTPYWRISWANTRNGDPEGDARDPNH